MAEPPVTVKMLIYNHAPYIAQAIEGVLMQKTNFPFELVIGEYCSTDGTREIVFDYARRYQEIIRVVTSDKNVGWKENSKRVNKHLRGKYVALCEGDDYWIREDKLHKQVTFLENNPDFGMVHTGVNFLYQSSGEIIENRYKHIKIYNRYQYKDLIEQIVLGNHPITTCTTLIRKNIYDEKYQIDELINRNFMMGDTFLWTAIASVSKVYYLDECTAVYRHLEESLSRSKDPEKYFRFWISSSEMRIFLCERYELPCWIKHRYQIQLRKLTLKLAFLQKDKKMAEEVIRKYPDVSFKEKFWYYGIKNEYFRPLVNILRIVFEKKGNFRCKLL